MPAPKLLKRSEQYGALSAESAAHNETNDCAVKAVALVTGCSYAQALEALAACGRKPRDGVYPGDTHRAIRNLGFELHRVHAHDMLAKYPAPHNTALRNITTYHPARFHAAWADGCTYLLHVSGHVAAVINGVTHDWTASRARRVVMMYRVERIQDTAGLDTHKAAPFQFSHGV